MESQQPAKRNDQPEVTEGPHPDYLVVGHLNKAHGTKGEIFVWPLTDHPESHFAPGVVLFPSNEDGDAPSDALPPITVEAVRPFRKGYLLKCVGVETRSHAEAFRGEYVVRPFDTIDPLDEGEVFYHELLGAEVVTVDGRAVGVVKEVYPVRPADLLEVEGEDGVFMIPVIPEVVVEFDRAAGRVVLDPPTGLLAGLSDGSADPPE